MIDKHLRQLEANEHALVFMHHHPVIIGSPWMDKMGLQQHDEFWALMKKYPAVRCIVFGHIHSEFSSCESLSENHTIDVLGTPATCVQVKHIDEHLRLDHIRPAWRELTLQADGRVETAVHYLPDN